MLQVDGRDRLRRVVELGWAMTIRPARLPDIEALLDIENASFTDDRFNRRRFHHLLTRAHAVALVAEDGGQVCGYAAVLMSRGTSLARLYSMAVSPECRKRRLGRELLAAAEEAARQEGAAYMRLEVRPDNVSAQALYSAAGYREFGVVHDYYEDGADALRMEKLLLTRLDPEKSRVPYYPQTLDFTCGPAALLMAMHALDPQVAVNETAELRIWRESTLIFMTSGHGGCGPFGLALVAHRLGFGVEVYVSQEGTLFADGVRSATKRRVMQLVQEDFLSQLRETPTQIHFRPIGMAGLEKRFREGHIPVVLVSSYRLTRDKQPHWVVVTGFDQRFVYVHDPYVGSADDRSSTDCMDIPILRKDFSKMARFGRVRLEAALILSKGGTR